MLWKSEDGGNHYWSNQPPRILNEVQPVPPIYAVPPSNLFWFKMLAVHNEVLVTVLTLNSVPPHLFEGINDYLLHRPTSFSVGLARSLTCCGLPSLWAFCSC